jgi:hypothetical protein
MPGTAPPPQPVRMEHSGAAGGGTAELPHAAAPSSPWIGVEVILPDGGRGVVRSVDLQGTALVQLARDAGTDIFDGETRGLAVRALGPAPLRAKDRIKLVGGAMAGTTGECISIEATDRQVVVQMGDGAYQVLPQELVGKLAAGGRG